MARRRRKKKEDSEFISVTGLWKPRARKKQLGEGFVKAEVLEDILEAIEEKGGGGAYFYLFKNEYAESTQDPRYKLTALPMAEREDDEDDDEEEEPRRRKSRKSKSKPKSRRRAKEDEDDDEDEDEDDEDAPF